MNPLSYPVVVEPLAPANGGGYSARVPDLPGCFSDGETPQEALINAYDAIGCWIEAAEDLGHAVPPPSRNPLAEKAKPSLSNAA